MNAARELADDLMAITNAWRDTTHEITRQRERWGVQNHSPAVWMLILGEEYGEAQREALEGFVAQTPDEVSAKMLKYRAELIQVAAVALSAVACLDRHRNEGKLS